MDTNVEIFKKIRKIIKVEVNDNYWFTRIEMKKIIRKLTKSGNFITDDQTKRSFVNTSSLFPHYLKEIWEDQETVNTHPNRNNLQKIISALSKESVKQVDNSKSTIEVDIAKVFQMLPNSIVTRAKEIIITSDDLNISIKLH